MIYLDNAATSLQKPEEVIAAVIDCLQHYAANPGRSAHKPSLRAARAVYEARERLADFFHLEDPMRAVFTANATEGLNLAIKGALAPGDHVITTAMEHNSVLRPLSRMKELGVEVTVLPCGQDGLFDFSDLEKAFQTNTKMVAVTHASNLIGTVMPVKRIGALCRKQGALFLVDAAQSGGVLSLDPQEMCIDLLVCAGHKSLFGMQGTGFLYVGKRAELLPLKEGGTGSASEQIVQPVLLPDRYESGTLNLPGIVSLSAGISFLEKVGLSKVRVHEEKMTRLFLEGVRNMENTVVYGHTAESVAVVSLNLTNLDSSELAYQLDDQYGICTRAGLHCAPLAHQSIGTLQKGAVRFSFGYFNTEAEVKKTVDALWEISKGYGGKA